MRQRLALVAGWILVAAGAMGAEPTKILFVGKDRDHPPMTHEYMADLAILAKLVGQSGNVESVVSNGWPSDPQATEGVDAIVLFTRLGGNVLFASPARRSAEALLNGGAGLVAIHWGTGADVGEPGERYLKALGGWYNNSFSQFPVRPSELRPAKVDHPILRGVEPVKLVDEFYIKLRFEPAITPLLMAKVDGADYPIGWSFVRPNGGRSFGFTGGHFHNNLGLKPLRQSLVNAILWSAKREIPAGGAPCELAPADLTLSTARK